MVTNVHTRTLPADPGTAGQLLETLASRDDALWPAQHWPPMRLDAGLNTGSRGGHGPVRYRVVEHLPGQSVRFAFERPRGFAGWHAFSIELDPRGATVLRHELRMRARGGAVLSWPLFYRPLHNDLIEEALDRAATACGATPEPPHRRSLHTRALRWVLGAATRWGRRRP